MGGRGHVKLSDFGTAGRSSDPSLNGPEGTVHYYPPERVEKHLFDSTESASIAITGKVDIWGVGCVLYGMIFSGQDPALSTMNNLLQYLNSTLHNFWDCLRRQASCS